MLFLLGVWRDAMFRLDADGERAAGVGERRPVACAGDLASGCSEVLVASRKVIDGASQNKLESGGSLSSFLLSLSDLRGGGGREEEEEFGGPWSSLALSRSRSLGCVW
jgi:hypothetical protein